MNDYYNDDETWREKAARQAPEDRPSTLPPLGALLGQTEDDGARAVIDVLRELRVASYDAEGEYWAFKEINVPAETFDAAMTRRLGRSLGTPGR